MGLFKKKVDKSRYVVKKRTPDVVPFSIPQITSSDTETKSSLDHFVSPLYGTDTTDTSVVNRESSVDVAQYDPFRKTPLKEKNPDDPYPEFRKVKPRNPKPFEKTVEPPKVETLVMPEITKEEKQEEPSFFKYDEDEEAAPTTPKVDSSMIEDLFGVEPAQKVTKPTYNNENISKESETLDENEAFNTVPLKPKEEKKESKIIDRYQDYKLPPLSLLNDPQAQTSNDDEWNERNIQILNKTLTDFRVDGQVQEFTEGPSFTRYAIILGSGVSGNRIEALQNDIQRALSATSIRIENPISGKSYIGIEVPNRTRRTVALKELLTTSEFVDSKDPLLIPVGLDVEGKAKFVSISELPHGLVAGSSGSGKSVFLACLITSLIYKNTPDQLRFFFVDPKKVDLQQFSTIPHLISPIVDDTKEAINSFKWLIDEMERRFTIFRENDVVNLKTYTQLSKEDPKLEKIPYIVVIIEEAGDFLLNGGNEAEMLVTKLCQKSRAAGIHIILAMQKPVAKILSTTIKSNASGRFAFRVPQQTDSMVILDTGGAEKLLGNGDMMFYLSGSIGRYQSAFVSSKETGRVRDYVSNECKSDYLFEASNLEKKAQDKDGGNLDELFDDVANYVVSRQKCSINAISQSFNIGFNRANAIVESLERNGIVSENLGTKAREVLVQMEDLEDTLKRIHE